VDAARNTAYAVDRPDTTGRLAFPADCPHLSHFHCSTRFGQNVALRVVQDTRVFQHIAKFYNYLGQLIVTAAVYRGLASLLRVKP
jgi:hypothetical protein